MAFIPISRDTERSCIRVILYHPDRSIYFTSTLNESPLDLIYQINRRLIIGRSLSIAIDLEHRPSLCAGSRVRGTQLLSAATFRTALILDDYQSLYTLRHLFQPVPPPCRLLVAPRARLSHIFCFCPSKNYSPA